MCSKLKKGVILLVVCILTPPYVARSQSRGGTTWEQFVEEYAEYVTEAADAAETAVERFDWLEELEAIHLMPIAVNTAIRIDLQSLHFLSDEKIDSLLAHRDRYRGGLRSLGELMTIRELDYRDRAWLSLLLDFTPAPPTSADSARSDSLCHTLRRLDYADGVNKWWGGQYEFSATMDAPLNRRAGFYDYDTDNYPTRMFTGYNVAHTVRAHYNWLHRVMYGVTVQEDVGERFGAYGSRPWDFQSFHFFFKSDPERADRRNFNRYTLAVGDYRISLGQGLVMGYDTWSQRLSLLTGLRMETTRFRPHTGTDESRFLRGAAATVCLDRRGHVALTAFGSARRLDGTVKGATADNGYNPTASDTITAWKTDGLHRTFQEISKRNVATQWILGGRLGYQTRRLNVGLNGVWMHYDKVYWPAARLYNKYYMRGHNATAFSADYSLRFGEWSIQGEAALDKSMAYASTLALRWTPLTALTLVLQERSFGGDYVSPCGHTLQANSQLQNEHGAMFGIRYTGVRRLELVGYADLSLHPRPIYLADTLSHRFEALAQATYRTPRGWTLFARYKVSSREQNVTGYRDIPDFDDVLLSWRSTQRLRLQASWAQGGWGLSMGVDGACYYSQGSNFIKKTGVIEGCGTSLGGLIFARANTTVAKRLKLSAMLTAFKTDDYNARVYAYAPQLHYGAAFPTYSGRGVAGVVLGECRTWRNLYVGARMAVTKYADRDVISSGVNAVDGSCRADLSVQIVYKLQVKSKN